MEKELIKEKKVHTDENLLNMMTKVVTHDKLELCKELADMDSKWRGQGECPPLMSSEGRLLGLWVLHP